DAAGGRVTTRADVGTSAAKPASPARDAAGAAASSGAPTCAAARTPGSAAGTTSCDRRVELLPNREGRHAKPSASCGVRLPDEIASRNAQMEVRFRNQNCCDAQQYSKSLMW